MISACGSQASDIPSATPTLHIVSDEEKALALAFRGCMGPNVEYAYKSVNNLGWLGQLIEVGLNEGFITNEKYESNKKNYEFSLWATYYFAAAQQSAVLLDAKWKPLMDSYRAAGKKAVEAYRSGSNVVEAFDLVPLEYVASIDAICRIATNEAIDTATQRGLTVNVWIEEVAGTLLPEEWKDQ